MANRGANGCLKLFLIVVNFLFLIVGVAILAVGIYFCTNANLIKYSEIFAGLETLRSVRFILIACGSFIVLVGFCGFVGACKENRCLIILYTTLCVLILIGNIIAVVLAFVYNKQVKSYVSEQVKDRMKRFYGGNVTAEAGSDVFTKGIDAIQKEERCCGWTGLGTVNFFTSTPWYANQKGSDRQLYPESCCPDGVLTDPKKKEMCVRATDETVAREDGYMHTDDCSEKLMALNSRFAHMVLGSVLLAILLQFICIICSVVIARQVSADNGGRVV